MIRLGDGEVMFIFGRAERSSAAVDHAASTKNVCWAAEPDVLNRTSRRERPTYHRISLTQDVPFSEGVCVAVSLYERYVQACYMCCLKKQTVRYLLPCCRSVASVPN